MTSRAIASLSAAVLGGGGLLLLFAPEVVVEAMGGARRSAASVLAQVLGGAWLGVAMLDWYTRGQPIGGIYGRPVVFANLMLYFVATTTLAKGAAWGTDALWVAAAVTAVMTTLYGWLLFRAPR
jgi:hypothetical protein